MNNWISVKDRLPKYGDLVCLWTTLDKCAWLNLEIVCINKDCLRLNENGELGIYNEYSDEWATHWFPIPDPPEDEGGVTEDAEAGSGAPVDG